MNLRAYLDSLRGKTVAVIGIGVSNTPLVKLLCREGISVTACDRRSRADLGGLAGELEGAGAALQLGDGYLENLTQDVIFRTPACGPDVPAAPRGCGARERSDLGDGGVFPCLPLPDHRRDRIGRQDHDDHDHRGAAARGGEDPSTSAATSATRCCARRGRWRRRTGPCWSCRASSS